MIYHSQYEHLGSYGPTILPRREYAFLYLDESFALHLLHVVTGREREVPDKSPSGV